MQKLETKQSKLEEINFKIVGDTGTFEAYGSKFGGVDSYRDTILPGAYVKSLAKRMPKMLFNHIGYRSDMPAVVGRYTFAEEDTNGLFLKGKVTLGHPIIKNSWETIQEGLFDGLSIGFYIPPGGARYNEETDVRELSEIDLVEVSLVESPADDKARIIAGSVKSVADITDLRDVMEILRERGFDESEAKSFLSAVEELARKPTAEALALAEAKNKELVTTLAIQQLSKILRGA